MTPGPARRLAVLNPGGRDRPVDYADGPGAPGDPGHPPINHHAYAAATRGAFFHDAREIAARREEFDAVLVLIRRRVGVTLAAVRALKAASLTVLVAWKEAGPWQVAAQLGSHRALTAYAGILEAADGIVSPTAVLPPRWGPVSAEAFARKTHFIPTPYPVEFGDWDHSLPHAEREGILVGTREFFVPTRNHLHAVTRAAELARACDAPLTVVNGDRRRGRRRLADLRASMPAIRLRIVDRPLPYADYLRMMATHRIVYQLDRGFVPGQVAGDAALCRTLCAGGNSAVEHLVFPELADDGSGDSTAVDDRVRLLLADRDACREAVERSTARAADRISFGAVAARIADFLDHLRAR